MVVPFANALSFFLGLYAILPAFMVSFIQFSLIMSFGIGFIRFLIDSL